jgi:Na+-transporting methylmalonyl-CoA/oxaloacetate decarboxylase gamma subunit
MLGIKDPWILTAYLLCFLSALACVVYGIYNWNKGNENEKEEIKEEAKWEKKESEIEETL